MPGRVYRLFRGGTAQGLYRVSSGPGDGYVLTPLTDEEVRKFDFSTLEGVIEWQA